MNTNRTALNLAEIIVSLNRLYGREIIADLSVGQAAERQAAYFDGINAVEDLATRNGNTLDHIEAIAATLDAAATQRIVDAAAEIIRRRADL